MRDALSGFLLGLGIRRIGWREGVVLLVPGLAGIHLLAPRRETLLDLVLIALVVAALAAVAARRRSRGGWSTRAAPQLQIVTRKGLMLAGDALLQQAVADHRSLSVAVLELSDLPEVRRLFGRKLAQHVLTRTSKKLRAVAGPKGLAVRTSPTQFTLVLPGVDEDAVVLSLHTVFGEACCIEDDGDAEEVVLLPQFEVATVDAGGGSIEPAYVTLCERLSFAQRRAGARGPRRRADAEPSRPVSLNQAQDEDGLAPAVFVPTVPLPLQ